MTGSTVRRGVLIAAAALLLAAVATLALWQVSRARCFVLVGDITCRVETAAPLVALTFDDGPDETAGAGSPVGGPGGRGSSPARP